MANRFYDAQALKREVDTLMRAEFAATRAGRSDTTPHTWPPQKSSTGAMTERDRLLSLTPLGQVVLDDRKKKEAEAEGRSDPVRRQWS